MKSKGNSHTSSSTSNVQNKVPAGGGGGGTRGNENKSQPTAEQIRYAKLSQMSGQEDHKIQEKIKQVADITGKSLDTVAMALHELNYDESTAIQKLIDGDYDVGVEWTTTASKKKKPTVMPAVMKTPNEPTPDTGPTAKDIIDEPDQKPASKLSNRGGRIGRRGRSRKPDEKEDRFIENEDDIDKEKGRSSSERGRGRAKLQNRNQSRGRGRSAGYGNKGNFGRGGSRSRGRQPRRGRGRGGFGSIEQDTFPSKNESGGMFDSGTPEDWDDDPDDSKTKSQNWGDLSDSSPEQSKGSIEDWGDQVESQSSSLFYTSRNMPNVSSDSWKHANGPQGGWLDADAEMKSEDSSYLPENVDDAVILSKRAPHATKSEPTSYHSTSELSRATYASLQNNQFPSSNPETSLTSSLAKQSYQIESLLNQPMGSPDGKDFSSAPVISGIQDSRKLEQEQLQGQKVQRTQKPKRVTKAQPPCQPVEMPRSMMYDLDKQLSGLQFGSSPLSANAPQEASQAQSTTSSSSVFVSSSPTSVVSSISQESPPQPTSVVPQKPTAPQYKKVEEYTTRITEPSRIEPSKELPEIQRDTRQPPESFSSGQHDLRSALLRKEDTVKDATMTEFSHAKTTVAETPRFNGVNDMRDSSFSQSVDNDPLVHPSVQDIRRQPDTSRVSLHSDVSQVTGISELHKSISQRSDVSTDRLGLAAEVTRASYMTDVSRHRKPQDVSKGYSAPDAVRHNVLSEQSRYVPRADVHKQSPPLTSHSAIRQSLRSDTTRSSILPDMRLVQGNSRRAASQEPSRHDVSDVAVPSMPVSLSKPEKPKTPPGLSSLQERSNPNVYSASPSRDVTRLVNVTTALSMVTSSQGSLNNTYGGVSRGTSMVYVSSSVPAASSAQTSAVISNAAQSAGLSGTSSFATSTLATIGLTSGTSTPTTLKSQTASSKSSGPPGMLPLSMIHNVQQGLVTPAFPHQAIAAAPYHYDEMQMMQRMPMSPYFEPVMYTPAAGNTRENIPNAHTYQGSEGKYVRDNSSPVASSINQGTPHPHHPQATIFAGTHAALPYGYAAYYPPPGVIPGGFPVFTTAPVFPMGASKVHITNQYQSGYGGQASHGYSSGGSQDFSKSTYHSSVVQSNPHKSNQGSVSLTSGTSATDSAHHSSGYKVQLNQDTKSFVNGTPPPLGVPVPHGQSHPGSYAPQYMMQHASMVPTQHVAHHQMDSSNQSVHGGRPQQHLGIGGNQSQKSKTQSYWSGLN